jgi:nucleoside-diphosphate-sugar epimerase
MKRLLITGARGFIGRNMLRPAIEAGFEVHAVQSTRGQQELDQSLPVRWHLADLLAPGVVEDLIDQVKPTHLLHTAWITDHGHYWTSPANLQWLAIGTRLAASFAIHGGRRFVSVGTCAEYDWTGTEPMTEGATSERPATFYGRIKLCHHQMLMAASQQLGFSAVTGRVFLIYGPREGASRVIAYACNQLASGSRAYFSSGRQRRDFLHVEDAARGLVALLDAGVSGACNISSGKAETLRDVLMLLGDIAGRTDLISFDSGRDRPDDPPLIVGDTARMQSIGWTPVIPLTEGLSNTYSWWKTARSSSPAADIANLRWEQCKSRNRDS